MSFPAFLWEAATAKSADPWLTPRQQVALIVAYLVISTAAIMWLGMVGQIAVALLTLLIAWVLVRRRRSGVTGRP